MSVDILMEVPYISYADGYGQSAPELIEIVHSICNDNGLTLNLLQARVLDKKHTLPEKINKFRSLMVSVHQAPKAKIMFRYHHPRTEKYTAEKLVSYTMFETDRIPSLWVDVLNQSDAVIVPTPWQQTLFQSALSVPVSVVHVPLAQVFLNKYSDECIVGSVPDSPFIAATVGTKSTYDRKRMLDLVAAFSGEFINEEAILRCKCRFMRPVNLPNIEVMPGSYDTDWMLKFYLASHIGLYMSGGEGFGMPQMEAALLGRPVVVAKNTAMIWGSTIMPWVCALDCIDSPARYNEKYLGLVGNWGFCDSVEFIEQARLLFDEWVADPDAYKHKMIKAHNSNELRDTLSHDNIKRQLESILLPLL